MILFATIVAATALALLGVVVWNAVAWPRVAPEETDHRGIVSVLIPARDEADNLPGCLDSVLASGPIVGEVLVYDDHSTDGTRECIDRYAAQDSRVRRISPVPLEPGWAGKPFACYQLSLHATRQWWLYLDADARLTPDSIGGIVNAADDKDATMLSCWPRIKMSGWWEKLLMPLLNFVVFTLFPAPLSFKRADPSLGLAHGACILVRGDIYQQIGGHRLVRSEMFEDTRLAQAWRASGHRSECLDGQDVVRVRMYRSFRGIWNGFLKNFRPAFRSAFSFWLFMLLHAMVFLAPFVALVAGLMGVNVPVALYIAAVSVLAMRFALAFRFGHPFWSAALHPLGEALLIACGLRSWWMCRSGAGVEWKGRRYMTAGSNAERTGDERS